MVVGGIVTESEVLGAAGYGYIGYFVIGVPSDGFAAFAQVVSHVVLLVVAPSAY
jgi:hypothetical protein